MYPKIRLTRETILINLDIWKDFDKTKFSDRFDFYTGPLELIHPASFDKIIAIIGATVNMQPILVNLRKLKWLQTSSHGMNGFDNSKLYFKDVKVSTVKDVYADPISDFCIASYYNFFCYSYRRLIGGGEFIPSKNAHMKYNNLIVTILGLGNIGLLLAQKFKMMGWTVYGVKRTRSDGVDLYVDKLFLLADICIPLAESDYVVNLMPENQDSINFFNEKVFRMMKPSTLFCNVGRGSAVVDDDLEFVVNNGIICGAVMDAANRFEYKSQNILSTHHSSSYDPSNNKRFNTFYSRQLNSFFDDIS